MTYDELQALIQEYTDLEQQAEQDLIALNNGYATERRAIEAKREAYRDIRQRLQGEVVLPVWEVGARVVALSTHYSTDRHYITAFNCGIITHVDKIAVRVHWDSRDDESIYRTVNDFPFRLASETD